MKTTVSIDQPDKPTPKSVGYKEMKRHPGIYRLDDNTSKTRLISTGEYVFWTLGNMFEIAKGWDHLGYRFVLTNEKITVTFSNED